MTRPSRLIAAAKSALFVPVGSVSVVATTSVWLIVVVAEPGTLLTVPAAFSLPPIMAQEPSSKVSAASADMLHVFLCLEAALVSIVILSIYLAIKRLINLCFVL